MIKTQQILLQSATFLGNSRMPKKRKTPDDAQELYLCAGYCREVSCNDDLPIDIIRLTELFCKSFKSLAIELKRQALKNLLNGKQKKKCFSFKMQIYDVNVCGKINLYPDGKLTGGNGSPFIVAKGSFLLETAITHISYPSKAKQYSTAPSPIRITSKYLLAGKYQWNHEIYTQLYAKHHLPILACTKMMDRKDLKKQYNKYLHIAALIDIEWITDVEYEIAIESHGV